MSYPLQKSAQSILKRIHTRSISHHTILNPHPTHISHSFKPHSTERRGKTNHLPPNNSLPIQPPPLLTRKKALTPRQQRPPITVNLLEYRCSFLRLSRRNAKHDAFANPRFHIRQPARTERLHIARRGCRLASRLKCKATLRCYPRCN